uniref:Uncharacterized protein n=1 Tax=Opuntia streptacantha TaxID=393608 RepID=A0A7C9AD80_OPUST
MLGLGSLKSLILLALWSMLARRSFPVLPMLLSRFPRLSALLLVKLRSSLNKGSLICVMHCLWDFFILHLTLGCLLVLFSHGEKDSWRGHHLCQIDSSWAATLHLFARWEDLVHC